MAWKCKIPILHAHMHSYVASVFRLAVRHCLCALESNVKSIYKIFSFPSWVLLDSFLVLCLGSSDLEFMQGLFLSIISLYRIFIPLKATK